MSPGTGHPTAVPDATARVALAVWMLVILTATSVPVQVGGIASRGGVDKLAHFSLYLVLGYLWVRAFPRRQTHAGEAAGTSGPRQAGWLVLAPIAIFAGADELHQLWIYARDASVADWIADVLGGGVGIVIGMRRWTRSPGPVSGPDGEAEFD